MKSKGTGPSQPPTSSRKPPVTGRAGGAVTLPFRHPKEPQAGGRKARGKTQQTYAGVDLAELKERISSLPDMNAARLVELHNRLENKSLEADAHEIADKLMDLERWLESVLGEER